MITLFMKNAALSIPVYMYIHVTSANFEDEEQERGRRNEIRGYAS